MTARTGKVELCGECRFDGGWHYDDDGHGTRPHHDQAKQLEHARELSAASNEAAMNAGRLIIRDVAATRARFDANQVRELFDTANIPDPVIGAVFSWAASKGATVDGPLIRKTTERVMSTEATTRHEIPVWESLVYRVRAAS